MLTRRAFVAASAACALPAWAQDSPRFRSFLETLWPAVQQAGVSRATFDTAVANLTPDPNLMGSGVRQAEFERTIKAYLDDAVSAGRIARGRDAAQRWSNELRNVSSRYGVPAEIVLALWGMETDFGRAHGEKDVVRALATLAYARADTDTFRDEFIAALVMLEQGDVARDRFKGSWAGAMGHPQFMPSAYLKYAVAYAGDRPADIWASVPDSLASIANFMAQQGWRRNLSWGQEVIVPDTFSWNSLTGSVRAFTGQGVRPVSGSPLPPAENVTLFLPAGSGGPAFLLTDNYWVIKQYNNSDSYALSVALLADRIAGRPGISGKWPADFRLLPREDRVRLQTLLRDRGFYDGKIDGRFGPASRDSIHRFQRAVGMSPADGFPSRAVLDRLARQP